MFFSPINVYFVNLIHTAPGIESKKIQDSFFIPCTWNSCVDQGKQSKGQMLRTVDKSLKRKVDKRFFKNIATETLVRLLGWSIPQATEQVGE